MATQYMEIKDEAAWLEKRKGYVTSTQLASLFGLQMASANTFFELWHISRGNIEAEKIDNNFTRFGKLVEQPICEMILIEHPDWKIEAFPFFAFDDEDKIGSSFDRVLWIGDKKYLLEIKSTSYKEYMKKFVEHAEDDIEASPAYECQMQGELELVKGEGFAGCVMAVFMADTRQLRYVFREYDEEMGLELRKAVVDFWSMMLPPKPDYARDKSLIARLAPALDPKYQMDATENAEITELAARCRLSKDLIKQEEEAYDPAYGRLLELVGTAKYVWTKTHKIGVSDIKPNPGKTYYTKEGEPVVVGAREGRKQLKITKTGSEAEDE